MMTNDATMASIERRTQSSTSEFDLSKQSSTKTDEKMLAYDPEHSEEQKRKAWDRLASGALSGFICRTITQPLDVIKIRFQLQVEPIKKTSFNSKYTGISHTVHLMYHEEGIRSFWKGLFASQLISICYTPIQFTSFYYLTEQSVRYLNCQPNSPVNHFLCGSLAGMIAIGTAHPFDTLRTRLVGQGIYGLYRGLIPNLVLVGPQAGATFFGYEVCKQIWEKLFPPETKDGVLCNLTSGAISGIFAKSLMYPLDSIKKRLQVQGFEQARKEFGRTRVYDGVIDCTIKIVREETFLGLYKGFLPSLYKAALVTALNFAIFEWFVTKVK